MSGFNREYVVGPDGNLWTDVPTPAGMDLQLLVGGEQSNNAYTFVRFTLQDQVGTHIHDIEDESVYVLAGEPTITVDGKEHPLVAGSFIFMPKGVPHSIAAPGPWSGLSVSAPGGVFDKCFEEIGALLASGDEFTPEGVAEIQSRHGVRVLAPDGSWYGDKEGWYGNRAR